MNKVRAEQRLDNVVLSMDRDEMSWDAQADEPMVVRKHDEVILSLEMAEDLLGANHPACQAARKFRQGIIRGKKKRLENALGACNNFLGEDRK